MYWSTFYSFKNKKCFIKSPKTLILSFVEIDCRQLPLPESLGWACDCKLMEIFTGELLNDTLVNSPPRALAVRPSLALFIAVVLLMEVWGCCPTLGGHRRTTKTSALFAICLVQQSKPACCAPCSQHCWKKLDAQFCDNGGCTSTASAAAIISRISSVGTHSGRGICAAQSGRWLNSW